MPAYYEWNLKVRVPNTMVARGETIDRERVSDLLSDAMNANEDEHVTVLMTKEPKPEEIQREQS